MTFDIYCESTYIVQSGTVDGGLDDLDSSVVADLEVGCVDGQGHLRETEGSRIEVSRWTGDLENGDHRVAHIEGVGAGPFSLVSHVDVEEGGGVALEPTRLDRDRSSFQGPLGSVLRDSKASA